MRHFVAAAALLAAFSAHAEVLTARNGGDSVRLTDEPCTSEEVLGRLDKAYHLVYKAATAVVDGQGFVACWREFGGAAHILYEDGDQGIIPMRDFKPEIDA